MDCHIRIEFAEPRTVLEYRANRTAAIVYAEEISKCLGGATITIDDEVRADLAPLPCARLWA